MKKIYSLVLLTCVNTAIVASTPEETDGSGTPRGRRPLNLSFLEGCTFDPVRGVVLDSAATQVTRISPPPQLSTLVVVEEVGVESPTDKYKRVNNVPRSRDQAIATANRVAGPGTAAKLVTLFAFPDFSGDPTIYANCPFRELLLGLAKARSAIDFIDSLLTKYAPRPDFKPVDSSGSLEDDDCFTLPGATLPAQKDTQHFDPAA